MVEQSPNQRDSATEHDGKQNKTDRKYINNTVKFYHSEGTYICYLPASSNVRTKTQS